MSYLCKELKQQNMKGKYLITTDNWFYAPDGKTYAAVWGEVEILSDSLLGIKTNARATNWYAKVGSKDNHVIIAGCQIHYSVKCDKKPSSEPVKDYRVHDGVVLDIVRPSNIYIAE